MIAFYEKQPQYPPMHALSALAEALGVPAQDFLGLERKASNAKLKDMRI